MLSSLGESYGSIFAAAECDSNHGVELLSQRDMFRAEPEGKWIRRDSLPRPDLHLIKKWQVLIAGTGTLAPTELYGRSILADCRLAGKYLGPDGLALTFKEPGGDLNLFVYTMLLTDLGLAAVRSMSAGTKLLRPRLDMLKELRIPVADDAIVRRVATLIRKCVAEREEYLRQLRAARQVIDELPMMKDATAMCVNRKARYVMWDGPLPTIVAWSYAAAGEALGALRHACRARIRDVIQPGGLFVGLRFARIPCEPPHGVSLMSQRDCFLIRRMPRRVRQPNFDVRRLIAAEDQLLVACDGQFTEGALFGRVEDARCGIVNSAVTQHILRLVPRPELKAWVFAFLTTRVGHRLLQSTAVGTSVPMMRHDLVANLPVPEMDRERSVRIAELVERSIASRRAADDAEAQAVRIVEDQVLSPWLA